MDLEPRDLVLAIKARGLTQKQIQAETGIPQPTISKIERGDVGDVMSRSYRALLALHVKLSASALGSIHGQVTAVQVGEGA